MAETFRFQDIGLVDGLGEDAPPESPTFRFQDAASTPTEEYRPDFDRSLADEFFSGVEAGSLGLAQSMYGIAALTGRETGIEGLEDFGLRGIADLNEQQQFIAGDVTSLADVEGVRDFFAFAANGIGQAIPSLALAVASGGVGGAVAKKSLENTIRRTVRNAAIRDLKKQGVPHREAYRTVNKLLRDPKGKDILFRAAQVKEPTTEAIRRSMARGAMIGASGASAAPQIGELDIRLQDAGVANSALTSIVGGALGGALEALPAVKLIGRMFPGVDQQLAKGFIKDVATAAGTQAALEGSTEAAQQAIQIAAQAFHDPSFDPFTAEAGMELLDAFAIGALVGAATGAPSAAIGRGTQRARKLGDLGEFRFEQEGDPDAPDGPDDTFGEALKGRIDALIGDKLNPIMNTFRDDAHSARDLIPESLGNEATKLWTEVTKAHEAFVEEHRPVVTTLKRFSKRMAQNLQKKVNAAKTPEEAELIVQNGLKTVEEQVDAMIADNIKPNVAGVVGRIEEQDGLDINEDGDFIEESADPRDVQEALQVNFRFGKENTGGRRFEQDLNKGDTDESVGWQSKDRAKKGLQMLKRKFPSVSESSWELTQKEDGTWVVDVITPDGNEALVEDDIVNRAIERGRKSARRHENDARKLTLKLPLRKGRTRVDVPTIILAGKDLGARTNREAFATMLARLIDRGYIDRRDTAKWQKAWEEYSGKGYDQPLPTRTAAELDLDALDPGQRAEVVARVEERLADEDLKGRDRATARPQFIEEELSRIDEQTGVLDEQDFMGQEQRFIEQGMGRDLESDEDQALRSRNTKRAETRDLPPGVDRDEVRKRQQARLKREAKKPKPKKAKKKAKKKVEPKQKPVDTVEVYMEDSGDQARPLQEIVQKFANLMTGRKVKVMVVVGEKGADMIGKDKNVSIATRDFFQGLGFEFLRDETPAFVNYDIFNNEVAVYIEDVNNLGESMGILIHELGHAIHFNVWGSLSKDDQNALWRAFRADVASGKRGSGMVLENVRGKPLAPEGYDFNTQPEMSVYEFREWMADQYVLWSNDRQAVKGAVKKFLDKVGAVLQEFYDFITSNPRRFGKLNETFAEFADAVAYQSKSLTPPGTRFHFQDIGSGGYSVIDMIFPGNEQAMVMNFESDDLATVAATFKEARKKGLMGLLQRKEMHRKGGIAEDAFAYQMVEEELKVFRQYTDPTFAGVARMPARRRRAVQQRARTLQRTINRTRDLVYTVKAHHKLAWATPHKVVSDIAERAPSAKKLLRIFNRTVGERKDPAGNYHDKVQIDMGRWYSRYDEITENMSEDDKNALARELMGLDSTDGRPRTPRQRLMRKFFDDMLTYIRSSGIPVAEVRNYFPRAYNYDALIRDRDQVIAHLRTKGMNEDDAHAFFVSMISPEGREEAALGKQSPAFRNLKSRNQLNDRFFNQYLDDNLDNIVMNYINAAVKKSNYNHFFGQRADRTTLKTGEALNERVWNPKKRLTQIYRDMLREGATEEDMQQIKMYVDANLGMLGRDNKFANKWRTAMAAMIAYQNMRTLLFTVFASFPDMVGPAIRAGSMTEAFQSVKNSWKDIHNKHSHLMETARVLGIVQKEASQHIMTEYVDNHFMPPGWRKANEAFFKYTGLNWYTDFTRKMALSVGIDYIQQQAHKARTATTRAEIRRAEAALAELGVTMEQVETWAADGQPSFGSITYDQQGYSNNQMLAHKKAGEALVQFVNESIMKPNASQRPILASHPAFILVYHLKGYMYAMYEVVIKRMARNFNLAQTNWQVAAAIAPAIAILGLTAIGLELRELVQYAFTGRTPPTDRQNGWEYVWNLTERSGLLAQSQLAVDGTHGDLAFLAGPTVDQLADAITAPPQLSLQKALPIVNQVPALRQLIN